MTESNNTRAAGQPRVGPHRSLRVLFVDDETSLREFMRSELPRLGHHVTVCEDGRAALKTLEKSTFDAAILDLRMPGLSGLDVLEHLKKISPDTEAVVMTGHASIETATQAMRLGADHGAPDILARYQQWRRFDTALMAAVTDNLNRLFSNDAAPLRAVRDVGLGLVDRMAPVKDALIARAAGLEPNGPRLTRGLPL